MVGALSSEADESWQCARCGREVGELTAEPVSFATGRGHLCPDCLPHVTSRRRKPPDTVNFLMMRRRLAELAETAPTNQQVVNALSHSASLDAIEQVLSVLTPVFAAATPTALHRKAASPRRLIPPSIPQQTCHGCRAGCDFLTRLRAALRDWDEKHSGEVPHQEDIAHVFGREAQSLRRRMRKHGITDRWPLPESFWRGKATE